MQVHRDRLATRLHPGQIVVDVVRVNRLTERTPHRGRLRFLAVSLASDGESLDADAGPAARNLVLGQIIRVRGCVLIRKGSPILVISRLHARARSIP